MDKSIPYEIIVVFSIQRAVFVTEGFGTHKCVPYENTGRFLISYILYLNPINAPYTDLTDNATLPTMKEETATFEK